MADLNALHIHLTFERLPDKVKDNVQNEFVCKSLPKKQSEEARGL